MSGDFNVSRDGVKDICFKEPLASPPKKRKQGSLANAINSVFDSLTEFFLPEPTHIATAHGTMSHIDRFALGSPAWHLALFSTDFHAIARSSTLNTLNLSDHSIFGITISSKNPVPSNFHPLPFFITKHKIFKNLMHEALNYFNFNNYTPAMQLAELNVMIRGVAFCTKELIQSQYALTPWDDLDFLAKSNLEAAYVNEHNLNICSRLVWTQNFELASRLLRKSYMINQITDVSGDRVFLKDPAGFAVKFDLIKSSHIDTTIKSIKKDLKGTEVGSKSHKRATAKAAWPSRAAKRWLSFGKVLYLHAIETPDGPAREDADRMSLLVKYWANTFSAKDFDEDSAKLYLQKFALIFDFSSLSPTTTRSICNYLRRVHDTRPGPNGIPYSAYLSAGPVAWAILAKISRHAQYGLSFPNGFNDCEVLFAPKGSRDGDFEEVVRTEAETRPLKCKNADNKIVAGERNTAFAKVISKSACDLKMAL